MSLLAVFLSIVLFIISAVYLLKLLAARYKYVKQLDKIPGPRAYPIVGNLLDILVPVNSKYLFDSVY